MTLPGARLYGHSLGEASFTQVTRGFHLALDELRALQGFVAIDNMSRYADESPPGAAARVAFLTGAPTATTSLAMAMGAHAARWLMLAPNSDSVPRGVLEWIPKSLTGLLTPSKWGKRVVENCFRAEFGEVPVPVEVCPHGVAAEFCCDPAARIATRSRFRQGAFYALHLTSTNSDRKGTRALIRAWKLLISTKRIPESSVLRLVADPIGVPEMRAWINEEGLSDAQAWAVGAWRLSRGELAQAMSKYHVVIQPSRAEGFGLVPLEARALGVPVVMTTCTGHEEHAREQSGALAPGVVAVGAEALGAMDGDMPGAKAPMVVAHDVAAAVGAAYAHWPQLDDDAFHAAPDVARAWSWTEKTGAVLQRIIDETEDIQ